MNEDTLAVVDLPEITPEPPKDCRTCAYDTPTKQCGFLLRWRHLPTARWDQKVAAQQAWQKDHEWTADGYPVVTHYDCPEHQSRSRSDPGQ